MLKSVTYLVASSKLYLRVLAKLLGKVNLLPNVSLPQWCSCSVSLNAAANKTITNKDFGTEQLF